MMLRRPATRGGCAGVCPALTGVLMDSMTAGEGPRVVVSVTVLPTAGFNDKFVLRFILPQAGPGA